ncbi:MAG: hypothetical protein JW885_12690 [Deltaproteobacteria bacterium]|nr:hypothetical protein [Candidatus Zymogenaceae bacterium]
MTSRKDSKSPYSYLHLLMDVVRAGSCEEGVRSHDLKLQGLRDRPDPKPGTWGRNDDGSPMTREQYEDRLTSFSTEFPENIFPDPRTPFVLETEDGRETTFDDLIESKKTGLVTFPSRITSPSPVNNRVRAWLYPGGREKGVIILSNLRAEERAFNRLGTLLAKFGYTSLEMVHPYHGGRYDPQDTESVPGERVFSANMYETLVSFSQGIADVLGGLLFFLSRGITRIGGVGTSIGATFLVMALAHTSRYYRFLKKHTPDLIDGAPDDILSAAVLNLSGGYLRDFVTDPKNIEAGFARKGLVEDLGLTGEEIEALWPAVNPMKYVNRITIPILSVKAKQDPVVRYEFARRQREFFAENRLKGGNFREFYFPFPSGHYSATYFLPKMTIGLCDLLFIRKHV